MFSLRNKTAVITGATGVLGSAMSRALANAGANVVLIGRRKTELTKLADEIKASGGSATFAESDVLNESQLREARKFAIDTFGKIDILVNAAGGNQPGAIVTPDKSFFDMDMKAFNDVVSLNLQGTVLPTQIFAESFTKQREGVIINISSLSAIRPLTRVVGYSAAKSAVTNFTQWLAIELAKKYGDGIRVNAIAPGFFITEQNKSLLTNPDGSLTERGNLIIQKTPFGRFGQPEELAGTLVWLCSDASKFVTGTVIPVDGGFNALSI
jgi:NAD(P)-dependent dehydrogenase (short-subunit alcohol dehydrogenase family)